jgi:hypothetical protein
VYNGEKREREREREREEDLVSEIVVLQKWGSSRNFNGYGILV